jgi:hypothetical protein
MLVFLHVYMTFTDYHDEDNLFSVAAISCWNLFYYVFIMQTYKKWNMK